MIKLICRNTVTKEEKIMTEEQLNELNIFGIRELARRTGVGSPTTKVKAKLIKEIMAINSGVQKPHVPKTKQGRPPKAYAFSNLLNKNAQTPVFSKSVSLNQNAVEYKAGEVVTLAGIVEIVENNSGFLWVNNLQDYTCYFISAELLEKWALKAGDKVLAEIDNSDDKTLVKEILNINGKPALKFNKKRKNYFDIEHVTNKSEIPFSVEKFKNLNIFKGENTYLYGYDNNKNTDFAIDLLNSCESDVKIYVNVSIVEKNKHVLKNLKDSELFVSKITDELETSKRIVTLAIERAIRMLEQGKNVVVMVDDALSVASVDNQELSILKRMMSITKNADAGSISILAIMDEDKQINQIEKLADKRIKIKG